MDFKTFNAEEYYRSKGWLIGEGYCGGKAKGLAYATCALKESDFADEIKTSPLLFVLSTEVFHDFIAHASLEGLFECGDWDLTQKRIMETDFSNAFHSTLAQILHALDSAGQLPLAIRSSSLLEDSVSLPLQGSTKHTFPPMLAPFKNDCLCLKMQLKKVFASLFNPSAQAYRTKHGKQHAEEAMAVIIQPMIGRKRETCYYPELAGTLFSRCFADPAREYRKRTEACVFASAWERAPLIAAPRAFFILQTPLYALQETLRKELRRQARNILTISI
jgi:Phosphoenolpyruvate synthase/pyruvate phosphate dikinase